VLGFTVMKISYLKLGLAFIEEVLQMSADGKEDGLRRHL
jgi:hypothetical protein